jgi:PAS domain S-box-containing protein
MKRFLQNFLSLSDSPFVVLVVSYMMVLLVGTFDYITNPEFSFSLFYLIPIAFNTWFTSKRNGILIAGLSAITWLYVDISSAPPYQNFIAPYWNSAIRLGFFTVVVILLSEIKYLYRNLENIVNERTNELTEQIDKKNAAETRLIESRNLYQDLVENINEVYYTTDIRGFFKYVSPNFYKATGLLDITDLSFYDIIYNEDRTRIEKMYTDHILAESLSFICEFRLLVNQQVQWFEQNSRILSDQNGTAVEIRNLLRNISERKAAELSLVNSERRIQKLFSDEEVVSKTEYPDEMLSNPAFIMKSLAEKIDEVTENISSRVRQAIGFSSLASHELRTPLAIIRNQLEENLRQDVRENELKQTTASVYDEVLRLQRIINDLLKLSRMEAGKLQLKKTVTRIDLYINSFYEEAKLLAQEKQIKVTLCKIPSVMAEIDTDYFRQMLFNIFDNAVKFTPYDGNITLGCNISDNKVDILFKDSGAGIPEDIISKLFTPFYQSQSEDTPKGTGLGLILSKWIAELHNGNIEIISKAGSGTAVHIKIPLFNPLK